MPTRPLETVGDLARLGARRTPAAAAISERESGRSRTYAQLDERTDRLAHGLLGTGLDAGDRVAAWMEDGLEYVELYLAAAKAGLVVVPVNARFLAGEAEHLLSDSGARMLVWTDGVAERVDDLDAADLVTVTVGERGADHAFEELVAGGTASPPPAPDRDAVFVLGYTSGTTGPPKGAMLTHRSVLAICRMNAISYRLPLRSVAALTGSMSFVATVPAHILSHLYVGGEGIVMGRWDPAALVDTIAARGVTFTYVPAPLMLDVAAEAARRPGDWATLESVLHSASRADPAHVRELCAVIGGRYVEGWGMTENSGGLMTATTRADVESGDERALTTVGRSVAEAVVEVLGPDGEVLAHDGSSVGELVFASAALMDGYHGRPDATAEALRDGWFHSGDLGSIDPDGFVTIADRRTDLIVSGGMNVYPSEVEEAIATLDGVAECAVVGQAHERWGQTVVAAVVADDRDALDADAVIAHCRERLSGYKKPTRVVFLDALPRTASMKVRRGEVRDLVAERLADEG